MVVGVFAGIRSIGVDRLQAIVDATGIWGSLIYIALRAVASVLAPFSSGPLQLASGVLFGLPRAILYSALGSTIGYSLSFWIARRYGRSFVARLVGKNIEQVDRFISRLDHLRGLVSARIMLYFAYDFVAYAAGLSKVKFLTFAVVTFVVGIPPITLSILLGLGLLEGTDWHSWFKLG